MLPLKKKQQQKIIKEPDAKCIYLFIHSVSPPPFICVQSRRKPVGRGDGAKINNKGGKGRCGDARVNRRVTYTHKHTYMHLLACLSFFSALQTNAHTHTHAHRHTQPLHRGPVGVFNFSTPTSPGPITEPKKKRERTRKGKKKKEVAQGLVE